MLPKNSSIPPGACALLDDFFLYAYAFCKDLGLSPRKVSTFLGIIKTLVAHDTSTPYSPSHPLSKTHKMFVDLLMKHSIDRPPLHMKLFSREDVAQIDEFMLQQYFRMWRVHKVACCPRVQVRVEQTVGGVEVPPKGRGLGIADEADVVVLFPEPVEEEPVEEGGGEAEGGGEKKEGEA
ncbi:hypothetical protein TeGR_g12329 [Tetraparma gracilis]|uniref:Uncharacterized protein n=1 Tax=Tetraparma gracilis TaxID=2962635 RepID=A0ABQ6M4X9_9STRA|nr:hypothetical protein TeGR_g12329 [Tetraparma gracilis]